jgi:hypothetical protein
VAVLVKGTTVGSLFGGLGIEPRVLHMLNTCILLNHIPSQPPDFQPCPSLSRTVEGEFRGIGKKGQANVQLARILQYLECPQ